MTATVEQVEASGGYSIIYADPPWQYDDRGINGAAENHYRTMKPVEIAALPVQRLAAPHAVLFLWYCNPLLPQALDLLDAWGFTFKTLAFTWVKSRGAGEHFGLGRWTRGNTESVMLGVRGKPPRPINNGVRQLVWGETETIGAPVGRHSAKPPEVRDRIVELMGDLPRLELFARDRSPGWDLWGNELHNDIDMGVTNAA